MSSLQCLDAVKNRTTRVPSRVVAEALSPLRLPRREAIHKRSNLYEVEVVEEKGALVKVYYTGYSSIYDEWKPKDEVVLNKPNFFDSDEQEWSPVTKLACSIKKRLLPSRSEDPEVRIQIPCDSATFRVIQSKGVPIVSHCVSKGGTTMSYVHRKPHEVEPPTSSMFMYSFTKLGTNLYT